MPGKSRGFDDRFLSKIGKIDRRRIHSYLTQILSQKQFLETIFDQLDEGIIVADAHMSIIYSNHRARRMLQWSSDKDYLGEDLVQHCPEGALREIITAMSGLPRQIKSYECAFGPDGKRSLELTTMELRMPEDDEESTSKSSTSEAWVLLMRDVTERRQNMEEQSRAQWLSGLALLTSGVAHEIKNPLNSLNIHAQILQSAARDDQKDLDRDQVDRAATVILEETYRLTEIVNEFIQATRTTPPVMERKSLSDLIGDLVRLFEVECENEGIELKTDQDPDLPPLKMDASLIFQALRNLIRNAIEAHQQGDPEPSTEAETDPAETSVGRAIVVRTRLRDDGVTIEVADNGPGIEQENIDNIFEPYYTTKFNGTGLGLMIVYRIVSQHHGTIHVDSHPGKGTHFTIKLPLAERPIRLLDKPAETTLRDAS